MLKSRVKNLLIAMALALPLVAAANQPNSTLNLTTLESGSYFKVPDNWLTQKTRNGIRLSPPDGSITLAVMSPNAANNADMAQKSGWRIYDSELDIDVINSKTAPANNGWDQITRFDYQSLSNAERIRQATAYQKGNRWTVLIIDGSTASMDKHLAAIRLVTQSLSAKSYVTEDFSQLEARKLSPADIEELTAFLTKAMDELKIPGAGLAIIQDGKLLFESGFGIKNVEQPEFTDQNSLFMVGSITKSLATLLLAKMIDLGKADWEDKVVDIYPDFKLGSEETTQKVLLKHLVCACTGLPRKDISWILNTPLGTSESASFDELANTEPSSEFGEIYQYNNLMASAAGYIAGKLAYPDMEIGPAFDKAMQTYLFEPMGMINSTFDYDLAYSKNHAAPHGYDQEGEAIFSTASRGFNNSIIPYRPAGGLWSSAHDMIQYLSLELTQGKLKDGQQLISSEALTARREPFVSIGDEQYYGMGLMINRQWGIDLIHHGGSTAGFKSDFAVIPNANTAAVLLTNSDYGYYAMKPFFRKLVELLYQAKPQADEALDIVIQNTRSAYKKAQAKLSVPATEQAIAALAPNYINPVLGFIKVTSDEKGLWFDVGGFKSRMGSTIHSDDSISYSMLDAGAEGFTFSANNHANKRTLTIEVGQHRYVYEESEQAQ